jgi:hypothetical protein
VGISQGRVDVVGSCAVAQWSAILLEPSVDERGEGKASAAPDGVSWGPVGGGGAKRQASLFEL